MALINDWAVLMTMGDIEGMAKQYRKRQDTITAMKLPAPVTIVGKNKKQFKGEAGDYLILSDEGNSIIPAAEFHLQFEEVDNKPVIIYTQPKYINPNPWIYRDSTSPLLNEPYHVTCDTTFGKVIMSGSANASGDDSSLLIKGSYK